MDSEYRQFTDQIAADASVAASTLPPPPVFAWLSGEWNWNGQTAQFANTPFGVSLNSRPFLIHNAETELWILVLSDPKAFGILIGLGLRGGQARFTGDVTIDGQPIRLRQTWRRHQEFAVEIENERDANGQWQPWNRALLERLKPVN